MQTCIQGKDQSDDADKIIGGTVSTKSEDFVNGY